MLKNFGDINMSIEVKAGNLLRTMSVQKNILAQVEVETTFPQDFALYEVNRFLGAVSLFDDPEFTFGEKVVKIGSDIHSLDYVYCDPSMIITPPVDNVTVPEPEVKFNLSHGYLSQVLKAGNVLGTPEISIESEGNGSNIFIKALDVNNDSSDTFHINLGPSTYSDKFRFVFKTENFKMIYVDYDVEISSKGIAKFSYQNKLQYFIATESSSTFGG
jgi:hypothetical protein